MSVKKFLCFCVFAVAVQIFLDAQSHISVPLGHPVYHVIEQAQLRGLHRFLPSVRPYTRAQVLSIITEILHNDSNRRFGGLTPQERRILQRFQQDLNPERDGLNLTRGTISTEHYWNDVYFSAEFGIGFDLGFSASVFPIAGGFRGAPFDGDPENPDLFAGARHPASGDFFGGTDSSMYMALTGDLGRNHSYGFKIRGSFIRAPRAVLGRMHTFFPGYYNPGDPARQDRIIFSHSEPLTHFPFTFSRNWDGSLWFLGSLDAASFEPWPYVLSFGYSMLPEMSGAFLNGHVTYRVARLNREWVGMANNASLTLNQSAQPFLAAEMTFVPFRWLSFSALTGILEYDPIQREYLGRGSGLKRSAAVFQNAFSINVVEFKVRDFFRVNFGSATVWAKRFHLGYLFPMADTFLTQNTTGDFDNSALFLNLMGQYPGLGNIWFSLFVDEISFGDVSRDFFNMSRMMIAYQIGMSFHLPWLRRVGWLAFNSLTISYTKIEPFTFTHTREHIPGYGDLLMETNWVNFGRPLGHYLPPNSDELLIRFTAMPARGSTINLQYQLIRHGANFGTRAVNGSSHWSELDPRNRNAIRKYFLRDGAYQWMHIIRLGGSYSFTGSNLPFSVFAEIGMVYSYFTDIDANIPPNSGRHSFRRVDTPEYPRSLSFIGTIGVRIFPKW